MKVMVRVQSAIQGDIEVEIEDQEYMGSSLLDLFVFIDKAVTKTKAAYNA